MHSELSSELWLMVFGLCDRTALLQLNRVSKSFHAMALTLLYRHIDLSTHNSGILHPIQINLYRPDPPSFEGIQARILRLQTAQEAFLDTLLRHPEYSDFIHTFT